MAGAHRSTNRTHRSNRKNGVHRVAPKPSRQPYNWLGVGAITLGMGAAMASGGAVANAKPGDGGSSGSSSSSSQHRHGGASNQRQQPRKDRKTATSVAATAVAGAATTTGPADDAPTASSRTKKNRLTATNSGDQTRNDRRAERRNKIQPTVAPDTNTAPDTNAASTTPEATVPAQQPAAPKSAAGSQPVALAAVKPLASTDGGTDPTPPAAPTAHATDANPIIAAIQNALISFFTAASTVQQLAANGLTGPAAPSQLFNPVGAFLYGIFRSVEDFAGLVPHAGTPTTTSDPTNGTVTGELNFTAPSGAAMTYSVDTRPMWGTVTLYDDGTYMYKSNVFGAALAGLGINPTDRFTVTASTGVASTNVTVTVPVKASNNNSPSIPTSTNQHVDAVTGTVTGTLTSYAPDGNPVTYEIFLPPMQGDVTLNNTNGVTTFTYVPTDLARVGANLTVLTGLNLDTFSVVATSSTGTKSLPGIITVPIEPSVSSAPSTPNYTITNTNTTSGLVTGTLSSTSPDGGAVTFNAINLLLTQGTVTINGNTFTYDPSILAQMGASVGFTSFTFGVTATNEAGFTSGIASVTVPVVKMPNVIDIPSGVSVSNQHADQVSGVVTGTLSATDPAGAPLTYHVFTGPVLGGTLDLNADTGEFTYTPTAGARNNANSIFEGGLGITSTSFSVYASNGVFSSVLPTTVTVAIAPSKYDKPSATTVTGQHQDYYSGVVTGTLNATSPDGTTVSFSTSDSAVDLTSAGGVTTFTYTPTNSQRLNANGKTNPTDSFTVTAINGAGLTTNTTITVPVAPASNNTPSIPTATIVKNSSSHTTTGVITSTSPDGSAITYTASIGLLAPGSISANGSTGAYTYRWGTIGIIGLGGFYVGTSVTFTATNAAGFSSSWTVNLGP